MTMQNGPDQDTAALQHAVARDADGRPIKNADWEAALEHLERQRAAEPFDLNREVLYMCLKNRMTDEEGQRLLDLLHLLKNDTGLLETITMTCTADMDDMAESHRADINAYLQKHRRQPLGTSA